MAKENYNHIAASGKLDISDEEVVADLGLDPKVAGKKSINAAALTATINRLKEELVQDGRYTEEEINKIANFKRREVMQQIKEAEKLSGKKLM